MFGAVSLTKHLDIDQYKYFRYGVGFDRKVEFSFGNGFCRNVIFCSSVNANNKTKNILVLGKNFIQRLDNTTIHAEKLYSINFTKTNTKFCLFLHHNGTNSYLFLNDTDIIKFRAKDSDIAATPLCLGNISIDFSADNMEK